MKRTGYFLLTFILIYACQSGQYSKEIKDPSPFFTALVEGNDKSVFHGVDFNLQQDEVRKKETSKLFERTPDHLFYSLVFPKDSSSFSEYADIQYFFDKNGSVEIINSTVYLTDSIQQAQVFENFHQYFNSRYGDASKDDYGYDVWKGTMEAKDDDYDYSVGMKPMEDEYGIVLEYLRD